MSQSQEELKNENIRFYIGVVKLNKDTSATYLGLAMTTNGLFDRMKKHRGSNAIGKAENIARGARMNT